MTPEQYDKLPKWAQVQISILEDRVKRWQEQAEIISGEHKSNLTVGYYDARHPIPEDFLIRYSFDGNPRGTDYIEARFKNGGIEIYGSGSLRVLPVVSNVVFVERAES